MICISAVSIPHISVFSFKRAWQITWKLKREWVLMTSGENVATMKKMFCPGMIFQKLLEYEITISIYKTELLCGSFYKKTYLFHVTYFI